MPAATSASGHSEEEDAEHVHRAFKQSAEISDSDVDVRRVQGVEEQEGEEEELEVEEEIEVYEDVDEAEEENVEVVAWAEQETDSLKELEEQWNDVSQNMESNWTGQQWVSSSTPEISERKPLYDSLLKASVCNFKADTSNDSLTIYQEDSLTIHQEESHVSYDDAKAHKSGKPLVAAGENKSEPAVNEMDTEAILSKDPKNSVKPMVIARIICIILKTLDSKNKVDPMNLQAEDHGKQTASRFSRLVASNVRTQSLSPSVEFKNGSKC